MEPPAVSLVAIDSLQKVTELGRASKGDCWCVFFDAQVSLQCDKGKSNKHKLSRVKKNVFLPFQ